MFSFLIALAATALALQYSKNEVFEYEYTSEIKNVVEGANVAEGEQAWTISCTAHFEVKLSTSIGAYMALSLRDVKVGLGNGKDSTEADLDEDLQAAYGHPVFFFQQKDGSVTKVTENVDDPKDINVMKHGIINSLRTHISEKASREERMMVTDTQGSHSEYFKTEHIGNQIKVTSRYSESDFMAFVDRHLDVTMLQMDVSNTRLVEDDQIVYSESDIRIEHSGEKRGNDDDARLVTVGHCILEKRVSLPSSNGEAKFKNIESIVRKYPQNRIAPHLSGRKAGRRAVKDIRIEAPKCPGDLGACKVFNKTLDVGNKIAGVKLGVSSVLGLTPGCDIDTPRSYLLGIYLDIHVHALGIEFPPAVEAHAEYGELYGEPVRNEIQLHFLDKTIWDYALPTLDCEAHEDGASLDDDEQKAQYSLPVLVLTLDFEIGTRFKQKAHLKYDLCDGPNFKSYYAYAIEKEANFFGGATASIFVLRGGVQIVGYQKEFSDTVVHVDTGHCLADVQVAADEEPLTFTLSTWFEERSCKHIFNCGGWGKKHSMNVYHVEQPAQKYVLLDEKVQG